MEQQHQLLHQHSTEHINRQYLHGANGKREIQREIHIPTTDNHSQMESSAISNETDFHKIDAKVTPSYFPTKALLPYSSLPTGSISPHPPGTRLSIENPRSDTPLVRVEKKI